MPDAAGESPKNGEKGRRRGGPKADPGEMMVTLTQAQVAALLTGAAFVKEWTEVTSRYGEQVFKSLMALAWSRKAYGGAAEEVMQEYQKYLRQMANLLRIYGLRFYSELQRIRDETDGR